MIIGHCRSCRIFQLVLFHCADGLAGHIRLEGLEGLPDGFRFFRGEGFPALTIDNFLRINAAGFMACQGGEDESVILPVQIAEGEGKLVSRIVNGILANEARFLVGLELHGSQEFLLVQHIFGRREHFPKFPHFCGKLELDGLSVFTGHEILVFLRQPVHFVLHGKVLEEKVNEKDGENDADHDHHYIGIDSC